MGRFKLVLCKCVHMGVSFPFGTRMHSWCHTKAPALSKLGHPCKVDDPQLRECVNDDSLLSVQKLMAGIVIVMATLQKFLVVKEFRTFI